MALQLCLQYCSSTYIRTHKGFLISDKLSFSLNLIDWLVSVQLQLQINGLVTAANERARRQELLLGFSNNPVEFINGMLASQARDLRAPKQGSIPTALRRTQFFDGR